MKTCSRCKEQKPALDYYKHPDGRCRSQCKVCENRYRPEQKKWLNPAAKERAAAKARRLRRDASKVPQHVLKDSRATDRKRGIPNDLTLEFVRETLNNPCCYCGETKLRMSLDRVDNSIGHTQANVVPSCIRCNFIRGSMPYAAWLQLCPSVVVVRQMGLFGTWTGRTRKGISWEKGHGDQSDSKPEG